MPDPLTHSPLAGGILLWTLTLISVGLFSWKVAAYVSLLRRGRGEPRWDHLPQRLQMFALNVLGQKRMFDEPAIGAAHFLIFWSFVFYAGSFWWNLARALVPVLPIPFADQVAWMAFALELTGVFGLAALAVAAVRRYVFTPPRLEKSRDATLILLLIALVLLSSLGGEGFTYLAHPRSWRPVGAFLAGIFSAAGVGVAQAAALSLWMMWLHLVTVLGFLAYLPFSKHGHLLFAPFGVFFGALQPGLAPASSEGAWKLEEFTWRQLFSGLACAECGRCDRACPAFLSGTPLSPKTLMHDIKTLVRSKGVDFAVTREQVWACLTCAACMHRCPVFNEHLPVLIEMRRHLVAQGEVDPSLQTALMNLTRYGNSFGQSARNRAKWTQGLGFKIKDARKEPVEYLWLVGDYASFDPRVQAVSAAAARVFDRAGLSFGILYEAEQNSGNDVRRAGEEGLFETLRDKNLAALGKAKFERIVTGDPHTYHALKNEYGRANGVVHTTQLLDELIASGKLSPGKVEATVAFHDPCYLGRYNGVYAPPRRVLAAVASTLVEMPRNRDHAYCCGAGGGRIWMEDAPTGKERPAESRVREAAALPGVGVLAVACPKDLVMFEDALKTTGLEGKLAVKDIMQLVEEGIRSHATTAV
ncbi:MAG: (Fe-S)-binding protein [Bryobacteraceae bacterium]